MEKTTSAESAGSPMVLCRPSPSAGAESGQGVPNPADLIHGQDGSAATEKDRLLAVARAGPCFVCIRATGHRAGLRWFHDRGAPAGRRAPAGRAKFADVSVPPPSAGAACATIPRPCLKIAAPRRSFRKTKLPHTVSDPCEFARLLVQSGAGLLQPAGWRCGGAVPAGARYLAGDARPPAGKIERACHTGRAISLFTFSSKELASRGFCMRKRCYSGMRARALSNVGSLPFWYAPMRMRSSDAV